MTEFVRPIQESIEDILILDIETLCDFADHLKHNIPDSLNSHEASGYDAPMTTMTKTTQNRREGNNCFPLSIYTAHRAVFSVIPRIVPMTIMTNPP